MKVLVIGTGYVGLVTGACLAALGHEVTCVDNNRAKIADLNRGQIPIYEPGLAALIESDVARGRLRFTTRCKEAAHDAQIAFICVGTPRRVEDGGADLTFIHGAARELAEHLRSGAVIVTKSTVPVGTGDEIEQIVAHAGRRNAHLWVASNPEFLCEGTAVGDFMQPDRIVVGANSEPARRALWSLYKPLIDKGVPYHATTRRAAEAVKYASNAFLALKLSFVNELADLCESLDADISEITTGMGLDKRIGSAFLKPGPGYGGSCFPKDTLALLRTAQEHGVPLRLLEQTIAVNEARKHRMARKVIDAAGGSLSGCRVAVFGLTFKANTDDIRESPALPLIEALQRSGALVHACDPQGMKNAAAVLHDVTFHDDPIACATGAQATVFVTDWGLFKGLDLEELRRVVASPVLVDLRNMVDPQKAMALGFSLNALGGFGGALAPAPAAKIPSGGAVASAAFSHGARRSGHSTVHATGRPVK